MIGQSMINVKSGGRTRIAGISAALFLLIFYASDLLRWDQFLSFYCQSNSSLQKVKSEFVKFSTEILWGRKKLSLIEL